jgi:hypothetical protein
VMGSGADRRIPATGRSQLREATSSFQFDADDYLLPRTVEHLLREYSTGRHGYIYGDSYTVERDGRFLLRSARLCAKGRGKVQSCTLSRSWYRENRRKRWAARCERVDAGKTGRSSTARYRGVCGYRSPYPIHL